MKTIIYHPDNDFYDLLLKVEFILNKMFEDNDINANAFAGFDPNPGGYDLTITFDSINTLRIVLLINYDNSLNISLYSNLFDNNSLNFIKLSLDTIFNSLLNLNASLSNI